MPEFDIFAIVVGVVLVMLISTSWSRRPGRFGQRMCGSCGAAHPPFAQFCRRCGQRL